MPSAATTLMNCYCNGTVTLESLSVTSVTSPTQMLDSICGQLITVNIVSLLISDSRLDRGSNSSSLHPEGKQGLSESELCAQLYSHNAHRVVCTLAYM